MRSENQTRYLDAMNLLQAYREEMNGECSYIQDKAMYHIKDDEHKGESIKGSRTEIVLTVINHRLVAHRMNKALEESTVKGNARGRL